MNLIEGRIIEVNEQLTVMVEYSPVVRQVFGDRDHGVA